jgi:hypothetical protein
MSPTGQAASSTSNIKWLTDALADYALITGIDLSTNPFAISFEQSDFLEGIRQLLDEQEKAFKKFRNTNRRLINYVTPCVEVLHAISETLGEALSLPAVSYACHPVNVLTWPRSGPLPTSKGFLRWDRCSPRRTSINTRFKWLSCDE